MSAKHTTGFSVVCLETYNLLPYENGIVKHNFSAHVRHFTFIIPGQFLHNTVLHILKCTICYSETNYLLLRNTFMKYLIVNILYYGIEVPTQEVGTSDSMLITYILIS